MQLAIASDHGGLQLKTEIIDYLKEVAIDCQDFGTYSGESVDYPDIVMPVAEAVAKKEFDLGILCCGTGIGVSIAANKVSGIRAALCHDSFSARMAREHNNANIITMGERVIGAGLARDILATFLHAQFSGGRHARRVDKIHNIEKKYCCR